MGLNTHTTDSEMTSGRKCRLILDSPITVLSQPPFGLYRSGAEIARGGTEQYGSQGVHQLATGAWMLMSVQVRGSYHTERTNNFNSVLPLSAYNVAPDIQAANRNSTPNVAGLNYSSTSAPNSNLMLIQAAPASATAFGSPLAGAPYAIPAFDSVITPIAKAASVATYPADTAFQFTFEIPGLGVNQPGGMFVKHFGGPVFNNGSGFYCLIFHGDGKCVLKEATASSPGVNDWVTRARWQFSEPSRAVGTHTMLIIPHHNTTGSGFIEFRCNVNDSARQYDLLISYHTSPSSPTSYVYTVRGYKQPSMPIGGGTTPVYRNSVTGPGQFQISHRPDMRAWFQPSVLKYLSPGTLVDWAFCIPFGSASPPYLRIQWDAVIPDGCSVVGKLFDATTGAELGLNSSTPNSRTYSTNPGQPHYNAVYTLTANSDNTLSPILWGAKITRQGVYKTIVPTPQIIPDTGGVVRHVSFTGPEKDPTHETGSIGVEDPQFKITRLNTRANIPFIFDITYDPTDLNKRSIIGSGVIARAEGGQKGTKATQGGSSSTARTLASPDWTGYECTTMGEWIRLQTARTWVRLNLAASDDVDAGGNALPFKITDIVREMIGFAGYAPEQIDVPDNATRFFSSSGNAGQYIIEPLVSIGDWVVKILRDYLGWFLIWDANAGYNATTGVRGMWRVRPPTLPNSSGVYTPLCKLYTGGPANKAVWKSATYNGRADSASPGPYVGNGTTPVAAFIRKHSLTKWVKAAEGNAVFVTGTGELLSGGNGQFRRSQWAFNVDSFDLPGASHASPDNPDYMPWFYPIVIFDPSLSEQPAVDFLCRRYYDIGCHAIKMCRLTAPAVLVKDPVDTKQTNPRPLRYYDPITITNGHGVSADWLVRNCSIHFDKAAFMWMTLECEAPRAIA